MMNDGCALLSEDVYHNGSTPRQKAGTGMGPRLLLTFLYNTKN